MPNAYLFDIDGTIMKVKNRVNRRIIQNILVQFGITDINVSGLDFAGRTDRAIFSNLLPQPAAERYEEVKQTYIEQLDANLEKSDIDVLSGVENCLQYLQRAGAWTGLLTGNFEKAAWIKVARAGLDHLFTFGAFGDHFSDRNQLPPLALQALTEHSGNSFDSSELIIIGDTPRDIECAHSFGSISVAVSTGSFSTEELRGCQPDFLLESLEEFPDWDRQFRSSANNR